MRAVDRCVLRRDRQQPPVPERRGTAVPVQGHHRHAHLLRRRAGPVRPAQLRHRPRHGHRQRPAQQDRRQRLQRGCLGAGQRAALPRPEDQVHRGGQRDPGRGHGAHRPSHPEPERGAVRGGARRHQGVDGDPVRRGGQLLPALGRRVRAVLHDGRGPAPGQHGRAAAGQHLPLLLVPRQPAGHPAQLRDVPAGHHGAGQQERADLHEPVRRHGGRGARGAGEGGCAGREGGGVGERVAQGGRDRRERGQREGVQPGADRPRRRGHPQEARRAGDVRVRDVRREPEDGGWDGEALRAVQPGQVAGVHHPVLISSSSLSSSSSTRCTLSK